MWGWGKSVMRMCGARSQGGSRVLSLAAFTQHVKNQAFIQHVLGLGLRSQRQQFGPPPGIFGRAAADGGVGARASGEDVPQDPQTASAVVSPAHQSKCANARLW